MNELNSDFLTTGEYRGVCSNGNGVAWWAFGWLFVDDKTKDNYIISGTIHEMLVQPVIPETVGIVTDLEDAVTGEPIFEGDILTIYEPDSSCVPRECPVIWHDDCLWWDGCPLADYRRMGTKFRIVGDIFTEGVEED